MRNQTTKPRNGERPSRGLKRDTSNVNLCLNPTTKLRKDTIYFTTDRLLMLAVLRGEVVYDD